MPQYVWSQHHAYHHAHNGDWEKYRGPYATRSVAEYAAMSGRQQRAYRVKCSIAAAPVAGFIYLIFMPRYTWITGSLQLVAHLASRQTRAAGAVVKRACRGFQDALLEIVPGVLAYVLEQCRAAERWVLMCWLTGTGLFMAVYLISVSIAGGAGIVLFTVQHNFDHAYASDSQRWDHTVGAIKGTSFLVLPRWLNWFTVNIGYHHIHHLSAGIPNYRLVECHHESQHLFRDVRRLKLSQVHRALKCILWDQRAQQIISVAEYCQQTSDRRIGGFQVG